MVIRGLFKILAILVITVSPALGGDVQNSYWYQSSVTTDANGPLDLLAEVNYDDTQLDAPIAVVMHQYSGSSGLISSVRTNAQRLRDKGFFVISVAMRGRDGSDGTRDSGGVEIYDIYDAVEAVKTNASYASLIDPTNVHITGYSGGGGNVMSALTKFPDYFRAGSAFFGMSDYGFDPVDGWYHNGAGGRTSQLDIDVGGNPNTDGPAVVDRYHARASNLASKNNPYSEIHLFVNDNETTCPKINSTSYRDNAISAESFAGEFGAITAHIGFAGTYEDFDNSGSNDPDEEQSWPHHLPTANEQDSAEQWYIDRLLDGSIAEPTLNTSDELFVPGFVKTRQFELWLGDGQNAAGELNYDLTSTTKTFTLQIVSNDTSKTGALAVETDDMAGDLLELSLNGIVVDVIVGGGTKVFDDFADGDVLSLESVGQTGGLGDFDLDLDIDADDYATLITYLLSDLSDSTLFEAYQLGDMNGDRVTDFDDVSLFRDAFNGTNGAGAFETMLTSTPEPFSGLLLAIGVALLSTLRDPAFLRCDR